MNRESHEMEKNQNQNQSFPQNGLERPERFQTIAQKAKAQCS